MQLSAMMRVIWQIAGQEAAIGEFNEIEPEHFLMSVLKVTELPDAEFQKISPDPDLAMQLIAEVKALREVLDTRSIASTPIRRQLRAKLGKGQNPYTGGELHRSPESRQLFEFAERLAQEAGNEMVTAEIMLEALLASPTPIMTQVLGEVVGSGKGKLAETPLMYKYGRDITLAPAPRELLTARQRHTACKALIQSLSRSSPIGTLLISESEDAARSVVVAAAHTIAVPGAPPEVRRKRIVDIGSIRLGDYDATQCRELLEGILAEARTVKEVILFVAPIVLTSGSTSSSDWASILKGSLGVGQIPYICPVNWGAEKQLMDNDPEWKHLAQMIWIEENLTAEVPWEL